MRRIEYVGDIVVPLNRLQQEQHGGEQDRPVAPVPGEEQHEADCREQQEHITRGEKRGIERGEPHKQDHTPQETVSEILAESLAVAALDIECEAEQHGKNCIGFSGKKAEYGIEYALVQDIESARGRVRIHRENEMLQVMDQYDGHYCESAECVHGFDPGILHNWLFHGTS